MKAIQFTLGSFLFAALLASTSMAQAQRTFVSGLGNDANSCTRTAPCRTFGQAVSQTNAAGEIYVLDGAGYGPFTINKSVAIVAPQGVAAGISVFSGDGIDINAGPSDVVILRGLTVNNQGSSGGGIVFNTGGTLHVENCVVNGFVIGGGSAGVLFNGPGKLEVRDSIMRANNAGIMVSSATGTALAAIDRVRLVENNLGLLAEGGAVVAVESSIASGSVAVGFEAFTNTAGSVRLNLTRCVASNNPTGIPATATSTGSAEINVESCLVSGNGDGISATAGGSGSAIVRISNSTVTDNVTGLQNLGGAFASILSRGNNTIEGNTTNTSGTIGSYTAK